MIHQIKDFIIYCGFNLCQYINKPYKQQAFLSITKILYIKLNNILLTNCVLHTYFKNCRTLPINGVSKIQFTLVAVLICVALYIYDASLL